MTLKELKNNIDKLVINSNNIEEDLSTLVINNCECKKKNKVTKYVISYCEKKGYPINSAKLWNMIRD